MPTRLKESRAALTVSLGALGRNVDRLRDRANGAEVAAVVKADAYGLGCEEVARHLAEHCGLSTFFVAFAHEAARVRHAVNRPGIEACRLYVLNGFSASEAPAFDLSNLRPVLNSPAQVSAWAARGGPCALGVDVGMNRLGMDANDLDGLCEETGLSRRDVKLVLAHFSHASDPHAAQNKAQAALFAELAAENAARFPNAAFSLSNSGGLSLPALEADRLVRPGIALYGGAPDGEPSHALEAVATLTAPVIMTRRVGIGDTAGYDGRWTAERPSFLAVLAIGYADGYLRSLSNRGVVRLGGAECPVVGTVSMDTLIVDVTDAEEVSVGDRAELFGPDLPVDRVAKLAGTISYELLTAVGNRVDRLYVR